MDTQLVKHEEVQLAAGLGAWFGSVYEGLGILGDPNLREKVPAGTYEITGTQVALRQTANGAEIGRFNNRYGANNNVVVEPVDTVDTDAQMVYNAGGHNWAHVKVLSGELSGKEGYVATDYLGGVGYTKSHNGTGPVQGGGGGITPVSVPPTGTTTESDYTPWILGGAAVLGLGIIGWAVLAKPKKGGARHRRRRHA